MRLIHAVRDLNASREWDGAEPIRTIALFTDVDATATFVREADEAYELGKAADRPYIDLARLEQALVDPRRRCLGRLGIRRGGPGLRRPVHPARSHLHRPQRRRDASPG